MAFLDHYKFTEEHINYLQLQMPLAQPEFFDYLRGIDCSKVKVHALPEGSVVFPREPLLRVEGPIGVCQLLETTLLCIINFASLVATNAARMRLAVGPSKTLLEFGLRRAQVILVSTPLPLPRNATTFPELAVPCVGHTLCFRHGLISSPPVSFAPQGPDGGVTASRYCYIGGFDGTSNALAGMLFGMKVGGTHAHSFVQSFSGVDDLNSRLITLPDGTSQVSPPLSRNHPPIHGPGVVFAYLPMQARC